MLDTSRHLGDYHANNRFMKHDIIDNSTGNIVGCISFNPSSRDDSNFRAVQITAMLRKIEALEDRLHVLEQQFTEHLETHC